jgi:hypothetical protein
MLASSMAKDPEACKHGVMCDNSQCHVLQQLGSYLQCCCARLWQIVSQLCHKGRHRHPWRNQPPTQHHLQAGKQAGNAPEHIENACSTTLPVGQHKLCSLTWEGTCY